VVGLGGSAPDHPVRRPHRRIRDAAASGRSPPREMRTIRRMMRICAALRRRGVARHVRVQEYRISSARRVFPAAAGWSGSQSGSCRNPRSSDSPAPPRGSLRLLYRRRGAPNWAVPEPLLTNKTVPRAALWPATSSTPSGFRCAFANAATIHTFNELPAPTRRCISIWVFGSRRWVLCVLAHFLVGQVVWVCVVSGAWWGGCRR
jgi:hypothetical protein